MTQTAAGAETRGGLIARNAALGFAGQFIPQLLALITTPFIIYSLGPDRYGLYTIAMVMLGYAGLFDLGLNRAAVKFVAQAWGGGALDRLPDLVATVVVLQGLLGCLAAGLLILATPLLLEVVLRVPEDIVPEARVAFWVLAPIVPVMLCAASLRGILEAAQRFDVLVPVGVITGAAVALAPVPALLLGFGFTGVAIALVLANALMVPLWALISLALFPALRHRPRFDSAAVRPMLAFGGWITSINLVAPLLNYIDKFLIGSLISVAAVAFYAPAFAVASKLWLIPRPLTITLFPAASMAGASRPEYLQHLASRSTKHVVLMLSIACLFLVVFAEAILRYWLGPEFATRGALVLRVLTLAFFISSLSWAPATILQGIGRPDISAKILMLELPPYLIAAWLLIQGFGIDGAALAWLFRAVLELTLFLAASSMAGPLGLQFLRLNRLPQGLLASLALWAAAIGMTVFLHGQLVEQAVLASAALVLFGLSSWVLVYDGTDRAAIKALLRRTS